MIEGILAGLGAALIVCLGFYQYIKGKLNPSNIKLGLQELLNDEEVQRQIGEEVKLGLQELLNDEEVQKQIAQASEIFVEKLKMTILGSIGGVASGVSRQLKGAEREVLAEGINQLTGIPVGDIAAKYLQKYPALQMLLPMLMKQGQKKSESQFGSEF